MQQESLAVYARRMTGHLQAASQGEHEDGAQGKRRDAGWAEGSLTPRDWRPSDWTARVS